MQLHVYDLGTGGGPTFNKFLKPLGTGVFHVGVEVHGWEWSYSDISGDIDPRTTGVFSCAPRTCEGHTFSQSIDMGSTSVSSADFFRMTALLEKEWTIDMYDFLRHNCCHFADELCIRLGAGHLPSWIISLAGAGDALVSMPNRLTDMACCRVLGFEASSGCCHNDAVFDEQVEAIPMLGKAGKASAFRRFADREVIVPVGTKSGTVLKRES